MLIGLSMTFTGLSLLRPHARRVAASSCCFADVHTMDSGYHNGSFERDAAEETTLPPSAGDDDDDAHPSAVYAQVGRYAMDC